MITVIHGEDVVSSRGYYIKLRGNVSDANTFEGISLHLEDIAQSLSSNALFAQEKNLFIEDFFTKRKTGKETDAIISYINNAVSDATVTFWESKELSLKQLRCLKDSQNKLFKINKTIFQFLDALSPGNTKLMMSLFHQTLQVDDEQFIFFMVIRHLRMLLALSDTASSETIDELKRLAPWQRSKLQKQAGFFTRDHLLYLYRLLFSLDFAQKTGGLACSLGINIDFWLLEI